jgi:hypothetical protein
MSTTEPDQFVPPYISFSQLENVLERMRLEGAPARVDRSYLSSWSGSSQAQFLKAIRSLGLVDETGQLTDTMKTLVAEPDGRPQIIGHLLTEKYAQVLELPQDATQQQLDEVFRSYPGISGGTTRKAITFFLHAAKFAGIPVSPFFTAPRSAGTASGRAPRGRGGRRGAAQNAPEPQPPAPPRDELSKLHPAIVTLVQALPKSTDNGTKPEFSEDEREAWFEYARATFNLIYSKRPGEAT